MSREEIINEEKAMFNSSRPREETYLTRFGIPQFHISVETRRQELASLVIECHLTNRQLMPGVRPNDLVLSIDFPQFDL